MAIDDFVTSLHSIVTIVEITTSLIIIVLQGVAAMLMSIPSVKRSKVGRVLDKITYALKIARIRLRGLSSTITSIFSFLKRTRKERMK